MLNIKIFLIAYLPFIIDKINISGKIITADAMSMQKDIIKKIREKGSDFLIELKANQPSLRYGVEDSLKERTPVYSYTEGPELGHGRIESRTGCGILLVTSWRKYAFLAGGHEISCPYMLTISSLLTPPSRSVLRSGANPACWRASGRTK